jgi:RNA polymerase sigma-70 factor (ECF subfamily)
MTGDAIGVRRRHAGRPTQESWDEGRVISAAVAGDRTAFEMIVRRYDQGLRVLAWHVLGDRDLMDDALQDAYVKAFVGLRRFRREAALGTWLYRIVYTTCLTYLRRRRPHLSYDGELDLRSQASVEELDDLVAHRCDIGAALKSLPPELCATVLLAYREGFSYEEIGEALEIPPGTVGSRLNHARRLLRQRLSRSPGKEAP